MDEAAVDTALKESAGESTQASRIDRPAVTSTIRYALDEYRKERQRQKTEDTLRKLWRAVEQSADLVMITNREGVIEYVNPAFESLTGYSPGELMGQTPRVLKSGQHSADLYKDLWQTILAGNVFRCTMVNRKKSGDIFVAEKTVTPLRDNDGRITHFIWAYSEPGLGTTFKIYLPRARQAKLVLQPTVPSEGCPRGCETLLLAEDEEAVRQSAREFLTLQGYIVLEAANGAEALALAKAYDRPIDLMITDVVTPQMGGANLAADLATDRPDMKVLFVSGNAETTFQRHGEIDVITRFLQKPFSLKAMARKIREVLDAEKASAAAAASSR